MRLNSCSSNFSTFSTLSCSTSVDVRLEVWLQAPEQWLRPWPCTLVAQPDDAVLRLTARHRSTVSRPCSIRSFLCRSSFLLRDSCTVPSECNASLSSPPFAYCGSDWCVQSCHLHNQHAIDCLVLPTAESCICTAVGGTQCGASVRQQEDPAQDKGPRVQAAPQEASLQGRLCLRPAESTNWPWRMLLILATVEWCTTCLWETGITVVGILEGLQTSQSE